MADKKKKDTTEDEEFSANKLVIGDDEDEDEDASDLDEDEEEEEEEEEEAEEDEAYDEEEDDEDEAEAEDRDLGPPVEPDDDDPFWWTPHAVLGTLLVVGLLGFFGFFNKWLTPVFAGSPSADHAATPAPAPEPPTTVTVDARQARTPPPADAQTYGAKHILVQYKGSMRAGPQIERTKEEAKARAEEVVKKVAATKSSATREDDWRKLVTEYSDEPGSDKRGGDLGRFRKGAMVPQFTEGVEALKVGDTSPAPVETPFGYHVIWRTQ